VIQQLGGLDLTFWEIAIKIHRFSKEYEFQSNYSKLPYFDIQKSEILSLLLFIYLYWIHEYDF